MVAIGACTEEEGRIARSKVLLGERAHMPFHRHLAGMHRQSLDRAFEPRVFWYVDEQVIDAGRTDFREHLAAIGIGQGEVAH